MELSSFGLFLKIDPKFKDEVVKAPLMNDPYQSSLHDCVSLLFLFTHQELLRMDSIINFLQF